MNNFLLTVEKAFARDHPGAAAEHVDGASIQPEQLADTLIGTTLFSLATNNSHRLVIIDNLQANSNSWNQLEQWLGRLAGDIAIILIEPMLDKRTRTCKLLKAQATIRDFPQKTLRDVQELAKWTVRVAADRGVIIEKSLSLLIVERSVEFSVGGRPGAQTPIDQGRIINTLEIISLTSQPVSIDTINTYVPAPPSEAVFGLFKTALDGDTKAVQALFKDLKKSQEPHMLMGLISSQVVSLAALVILGSSSAVSRATGVSPYALRDLEPSARRISRLQLRRIVETAAEADLTLKSTAGDPWRPIELLLLKIATDKSS